MSDLRDLLEELDELLEGQEDVVDGGHGEPMPNRAMRLRRRVQDALIACAEGGAMSLWAQEWYSKNRLDGETRYLIWENGKPLLYDTREECRLAIRRKWGYILTRPDLRAEPHGWRLPKPVRVKIVKEER